MRILLWHVHGSWTTAFVQGVYEYLLPVLPDRGPDGRGRARTWDWPPSAREVTPDDLARSEIDLVVLQRPHEIELVRQWTGRIPGLDLPAVYVEHNTPGGDVPFSRHPLAGQVEIPIVHVTHFNRLFWDCGNSLTYVVEHGIIDPGDRYTGEDARAAVVVNDPVRRGRAVGADIVEELADVLPVDVFGMGAADLVRRLGYRSAWVRAYDDLPQDRLYAELARRRVYVHTVRWTSLGLSLLEAMHLGMPVVALAVTEAVNAVPFGAGVLATSAEELSAAALHLVEHPAEAKAMGQRARTAALGRYGLARFLADWDVVVDATVPARR